MLKVPCVYILVSGPYGTFYVGVTSNLHDRMAKHTQGLFDGFTKKHGIKTLVYYEMHENMVAAIKREKLVKRWNRAWKYRLIEQMNPEWKSLFAPETGNRRNFIRSCRCSSSRNGTGSQRPVGRVPAFAGMTMLLHL